MASDDNPAGKETDSLETTKRNFMRLLGATGVGVGLSGASAATDGGVVAALDADDSGKVQNVYAAHTKDGLTEPPDGGTPAVGITDQGVFGYDTSASQWEQFTDEPIQNLRETDQAFGRVDRPLQSTGERTIYVAPDGNDDAAATEDDPLRTVQEAFNRTPVFLYHQWTIKLADGDYLQGKDTFATRTGLHLVWAADNFALLGNPDHPENVTINALNAKFFGKLEDIHFQGISVKYLTQFAGPAFVRDCRFLGKTYRQAATSALSGKNGNVDVGRSQVGNREDPPDYAIQPSLYDNYLLKATDVYAKNYVVDNHYSKQARVQISGNTTWETSYGLGNPGSATLMAYDETLYIGGFTNVADDFNDDLLTGRITMNGGAHGGYRPEWSASESAHAAGGELVLPAGGDASASVPSPVGVGTWAFDVTADDAKDEHDHGHGRGPPEDKPGRGPPKKHGHGRGPPDHEDDEDEDDGGPTSGSALIYFRYANDGEDYYRLRITADGKLVIEKSESGSGPTPVASGSWSGGWENRRVAIERTKDGSMTVSVDGSEVASGSDSFQPMVTGEQVVTFENDLDATLRVDNVRIEQD